MCDDRANVRECIFDGGDCCLNTTRANQHCDKCKCYIRISEEFVKPKTLPPKEKMVLVVVSGADPWYDDEIVDLEQELNCGIMPKISPAVGGVFGGNLGDNSVIFCGGFSDNFDDVDECHAIGSSQSITSLQNTDGYRYYGAAGVAIKQTGQLWITGGDEGFWSGPTTETLFLSALDNSLKPGPEMPDARKGTIKIYFF